MVQEPVPIQTALHIKKQVLTPQYLAFQRLKLSLVLRHQGHVALLVVYLPQAAQHDSALQTAVTVQLMGVLLLSAVLLAAELLQAESVSHANAN